MLNFLNAFHLLTICNRRLNWSLLSHFIIKSLLHITITTTTKKQRCNYLRLQIVSTLLRCGMYDSRLNFNTEDAVTMGMSFSLNVCQQIEIKLKTPLSRFRSPQILVYTSLSPRYRIRSFISHEVLNQYPGLEPR